MWCGTTFPGEARTGLKWADGKVIKNEVDLQVSLYLGLRVCGWLRLFDYAHVYKKIDTSKFTNSMCPNANFV